MTFRTAVQGFATGLLLQISLGPVFFLITGIVIRSGPEPAIAAVLAVTLVDYLYIFLSFRGVGRLFRKRKYRFMFTVIGAAVLMVFGLYMGLSTLTARGAASVPATADISGNARAFFSALTLTLSSPLTIVFWAGIFATRISALELSRKDGFVFAAFAGLATPLFLSGAIAAVSFIRQDISREAVDIANYAVALVLLLYGLRRLADAFRGSLRKSRESA